MQIKFILNGRQMPLEDGNSRVFSYEAFCNMTGILVDATVTFYKADQDPANGTLLAGQTLTVKDGTIINVANTGSA